MANTKYLNQLELTGTFTPSNTAIVAGDNGQVIAQKTQGQINAITPSTFTTTTAASDGQAMSVITSWQSVTAASITVGAGTYIITYTCSLYVLAGGAGGPSVINLGTRLYNTTAGSTAENSAFTYPISLYTNQYQGACNSFTGVFVISGSTNFIVQIGIDNTVLVGGFGAQYTVVTALKIA